MDEQDPSFDNDINSDTNPPNLPGGDNPYAAPSAVPSEPPPKGGAYAAGETTDDERMWGLFAHLSPLIVGFFGPLIIWLIKKEESYFIGTEAKEALNFQLAIMLATLVCIPLMFICIGFFIAIVVGIGGMVYAILAAIEVNKGNHYSYPSWIPRFIK